MRIQRDEGGQMMVLVALSMTVLFGFMALAIDVGLLYRAKRQAQIAADGAAIAGALDYKYNSSELSAKAAAQAASTANGITNGSHGAVVTITTPPADGPYAGSTAYVEAVVQKPFPTFFMNISKISSVKVAASAVAGGRPNNGCIWTLAKSGTDLALTGTGSVTVPGCKIYDNSDDSTQALKVTGSGSLSAGTIGVVGGYTDSGSGGISPHPITGIAPAADPLANLPAPTVTTSPCIPGTNPNFNDNHAHTLSPGCYTGVTYNGQTGGTLELTSGNYTIHGNFTSSGGGTLTFDSGLYEITGNLSFTGQGPINGAGVTFYTESGVSITGTSNVTLSAPTSGTYDGMLLFQSRTDHSNVAITGTNNLNLNGIIYASDAAVTFTGSGAAGAQDYLDIISDSISFTGPANFSDYADLNAGSVLGITGLVE